MTAQPRPPATPPADLQRIAPGSRVIVRDQDWQVISVEHMAMGTRAIVRCIGRSELVQGTEAAFFSDLDLIEPDDPTRIKFRLDKTAGGLETRLVLESLIRRTPLPLSELRMTVGHQILADDLIYQREPFRAAMAQLQPRLLVADAVGLGKTIEVGMLLAELQRRGRANRVLVVVPRHIMDQVQHELWCRIGFPLVRLDSEGIQRVRQRIPPGRNPFTYFNRVIVSIDTLKNPSRYRHHLEKVRWDVVWVDESHKLVNRGTYNNQLAQVLAPKADALILTSATPHNGQAKAFAELISLLDPTAVPDPDQVTPADIAHLVVRRHKHSPDVASEIGDKWAERAEPNPIPVQPTPSEEKIFSELSSTWLNINKAAPSPDRLFPYTLLKAALSSPVALTESIENRLRRRNSNESSGDEAQSLRTLGALALAAQDAGSAKLAALIDLLKKVGVGKKSSTRVVVFSERIRTLDWIAAAVRAEFGINESQVETFHNSKSDEEQQKIIEAFSMDQAPIRILVTSDIAAEGVNLHHQCHHLVHFDLPWSLITVEQRNGRIDRYGQLISPEIHYLLYQPADAEIASDVRVVSRLIQKEHAAHKALGDAGSVMGLYSESSEESAVIAALRERTEKARNEALDLKAPIDEEFDPWKFLGLSGNGISPAKVQSVAVKEVPSLFDAADTYLRDALRLVGDLESSNWVEDGPVVSFRAPEDLMRRLEVLPQSYLKQRNLRERIRLSSDKETASQSLNDAINQRAEECVAGTSWPEIHYLGHQHPVLDWAADKILYRVGRNEAVALAANVSQPTIMLSGIWSNTMGEPIAVDWLAATVEDGLPVFADLFDALKSAGVTASMTNKQWRGDLAEVERLAARVVQALELRLKDQVEDQLVAVKTRLDAAKENLDAWQHNARAIAESETSDLRKRRRVAEIDGMKQRVEAMIADHSPAPHPLIRVIGALLPVNET